MVHSVPGVRHPRKTDRRRWIRLGQNRRGQTCHQFFWNMVVMVAIFLVIGVVIWVKHL